MGDRKRLKGAPEGKTQEDWEWAELPGTYLERAHLGGPFMPGTWQGGGAKNVKIVDGVVKYKVSRTYPSETAKYRCECCGHFQKMPFEKGQVGAPNFRVKRSEEASSSSGGGGGDVGARFFIH